MHITKEVVRVVIIAEAKADIAIENLMI
jgi:hypothetical protein